ncbi:MAG: hypothetical protein KatS3mg057_2102 [Herpetosiphonaceae bacterium]|nr:MAG: hypothetical protein KatS3mg057_2102 [Herpetosiphonaceae bacterium]
MISARIQPGERARFVTLALLLFINALVESSNEVIATSGFISDAGAANILWVWATDMFIIILASGAYSLIVDRTKRGLLAVILFGTFSLIYVSLYFLFAAGLPAWIGYTLLMVLNDQQWMLVPMLVWALANDIFSVAAAKRLFPLLGIAALFGGIGGSAIAAGVARWLSVQSYELLLLNAWLTLTAALVVAIAAPRLKIEARQSRQRETMWDALKEGLAFVREVPLYRYLTLAMVMLGIGLNAVEFHFLDRVSTSILDPTALQAFYGAFRAVVIGTLFIVQGIIATWLLNRIGFKNIFISMPLVMLLGLALAIVIPGVIPAGIAVYLARVTLVGVEEPSRRALQGMVPDERRGRVSAFLDGYLYPLGSILSCGMIGLVLFLVGQQLLSPEQGRILYLSLALVCASIALWSITRLRVHYDQSMLNWRLRRRQRRSSLADIEF